jgi:V/A-type H+-transporting ATPase subunit D
LAWPARELTIEISGRSTWGVAVAEIVRVPRVRRTLGARGTAPAAAGPSAARSAAEFETLTELLLAAAPQEMLMRRLGEALSRTSRQVNTLERRLAPGLSEQLSTMRQALDEREREEHLRLKHLKRRRLAGKVQGSFRNSSPASVNASH